MGLRALIEQTQLLCDHGAEVDALCHMHQTPLNFLTHKTAFVRACDTTVYKSTFVFAKKTYCVCP